MDHVTTASHLRTPGRATSIQVLVMFIIVATGAVVLALHTFAPSSAEMAPANGDDAAASQIAPQSSEPIYFPGRPY